MQLNLIKDQFLHEVRQGYGYDDDTNHKTSILQEKRLLVLIEGVLAANIFDWGSRACVDLYHKGTIIEIYRMSRKKMQRPWRVSKGICNCTYQNTL